LVLLPVAPILLLLLLFKGQKRKNTASVMNAVVQHSWIGLVVSQILKGVL
jgi:hypothetical protein